MLVVVILPLHGVADGVSSILSPAHYHVPGEQPAVVPVISEAPHDHTAPVLQDEPHDHHTQGRHHAAPVEHADHPDHAIEASDHRATAKPDHHQELHRDQTSNGSQHDAVIGRHSHGLDQANVVYLEGDPERSDLGAAGKHAAASAEAALPAWSMPALATIGAQALPSAGCHFRSCRDEPLLRPPSAIGAALA